jgi:RCC1 and BTB domain-containing protein
MIRPQIFSKFSFCFPGDDGRLGHGDNGWKYVPRIAQSLAGQVVCQVTCGSYHTAAVTGNGDLYTW